MRLLLHDLCSMHPKLTGHPTDLSRFGALALQRAGHVSPVRAGIDSGGLEAAAEIEWRFQDVTLLEVIDANRVTEEGAEAVALAYVSVAGGWIVKRRLQRWERADWLLANELGWLALEVSGTAMGDPYSRLNEKKESLALCSLPTERLAMVVAFEKPFIVVGTV